MTSPPQADRAQITFEAFGSYAAAAMVNANALIEEASLLNEHGHFARGYFLSVAAIEEIGKAHLAFDGRGRNLKDPAVMSKLRHLMSDHEAKIRSAFTSFLTSNPSTNLRPALELIVDLQRGRQPAMYTDLTIEMHVQEPTSAVSERASLDCVRLAKDCFKAAQAHMQEATPVKRSMAEDQLFAMKDSHAKEIMGSKDFWWYYLAQMEAGTADLARDVLKYRSDYLLKHAKFKGEQAGDMRDA